MTDREKQTQELAELSKLSLADISRTTQLAISDPGDVRRKVTIGLRITRTNDNWMIIIIMTPGQAYAFRPVPRVDIENGIFYVIFLFVNVSQKFD